MNSITLIPVNEKIKNVNINTEEKKKQKMLVDDLTKTYKNTCDLLTNSLVDTKKKLKYCILKDFKYSDVNDFTNFTISKSDYLLDYEKSINIDTTYDLNLSFLGNKFTMVDNIYKQISTYDIKQFLNGEKKYNNDVLKLGPEEKIILNYLITNDKFKEFIKSYTVNMYNDLFSNPNDDSKLKQLYSKIL